jgi:hypothetical protein
VVGCAQVKDCSLVHDPLRELIPVISDGLRSRSSGWMTRPAERQGTCGREDLNLHPFRDQDLNLARLPVPPRPRELVTCTFSLHEILLGPLEGPICKPFANQNVAEGRSAHLFGGQVAALSQSLPTAGARLVTREARPRSPSTRSRRHCPEHRA